MTSGEYAVQVHDLGKMYRIYDSPPDRLKQMLWGRLKRNGYGREFWALRGVSFEIRRGETIGVLGRNGSGKSTLLQMIAGTLRPTSGTVRACGRVTALLELGSGFSPEHTGIENVRMYAAIIGIDTSIVEQRLDDIVTFADIGDFVYQPVKRYSSGNLIRMAFAVATHVDAETIIVDEALSVGDLGFQFKCMQHLERLIARGTSLVIVSHDLSTLRQFCNRVITLSGGRMVDQGPALEVTERYAVTLRMEQAASASHSTGGAGSGAISEVSFDAPHVKGLVVTQSTFAAPEKIAFRCRINVPESARRPVLLLVLQNVQGLPLGSVAIQLPQNFVGMRRLAIGNVLLPGHYFITLRLEDAPRAATGQGVLLDKAQGCLQATIVAPPACLTTPGFMPLEVVEYDS